MHWPALPEGFITFETDILSRPKRPENVDFLERLDKFAAATDPLDFGPQLRMAFADSMDRAILHEHLGDRFRFLAVAPAVEGLVCRGLTGFHSTTALSTWPSLLRTAEACAGHVAGKSQATCFEGVIRYGDALSLHCEIATAPLLVGGRRNLAFSRVSVTPV